MSPVYDAAVIGAGFYGCCVALSLAERGFRVVVLEQESDLLVRASYVNQARVHNGYHYPRSFMTAMRSVVNYPRFLSDFSECIDDSFEKIYAIAAKGSKVTAYQFEAFCARIGSPVRRASARIHQLFSRDLIEAVFIVKEVAFDAARLRVILGSRLAEQNVNVLYRTKAVRVSGGVDGELSIDIDGHASIKTPLVFNCTYSNLNHLLSNSGLPLLGLKHEMAEIALIESPEVMRYKGLTVMDGSFFSTMPFPAQGLHSLTHVRYTPHYSWVEQGIPEPDPVRARDLPATKYRYMLNDAQRYVPALSRSRYVRSLFEVKTVLQHNENDDGRPILLRRHSELGRFYSVLGGKIDNMYDVLAALDEVCWQEVVS